MPGCPRSRQSGLHHLWIFGISVLLVIGVRFSATRCITILEIARDESKGCQRSVLKKLTLTSVIWCDKRIGDRGLIGLCGSPSPFTKRIHGHSLLFVAFELAMVVSCLDWSRMPDYQSMYE